MRLAELHQEIPEQRRTQAKASAEILGREVFSKFPMVPGLHPVSPDPRELVLNRTWRPALSVTGAGGLPPLESAGNVLRPGTQLKLSLRLPPNVNSERALALVKETLEKDPPFGATVHFEGEGAGGWDAPPAEPWLLDSIEAASLASFGRPAAFMGEGGSIPFMGMLGEKFPKAQFLITGVLGPQSNAHGPNEFLHLPTGEKVTACVAQVLAEHCQRRR